MTLNYAGSRVQAHQESKTTSSSTEEKKVKGINTKGDKETEKTLYPLHCIFLGKLFYKSSKVELED